VLINCAPGSSGDIAGVSAAVNCIAARPGPTQLPLVMQFTNAPAMLAWVGRVAAGLGSGTCGAGDSTSPWHHNDVTVGTLVCQSGSNGLYRIVWTFDDANIVVVA
jgi:hypothetical protein